MISVDQARQIVIDTFRDKHVELRTERVTLEKAMGRVLAQDLRADSDQPAFDRSIKDGFAVRSVDLETVPVELRVIGESRAGDSDLPLISAGEAVQIMTGAAVPEGADAVVMVEATEPVERPAGFSRTDSFDSRRIRVTQSLKAGANISPRGSEAKAGDVIVSRGRRVRVHETALASSVGAATLEVYPPPRVGILVTGDELVRAGSIPGKNQVRNTNSPLLGAMVQKANAHPDLMGIARDDPAELRAKIAAGLSSCDCLLLTGGVSAGKYDFVEPVLKDLGAEFYFESVSIRPGKPTVFGSCGSKFIFGLPGNPVSVVVTFYLFVEPLLSLLSGEEPPTPKILSAWLEDSHRQPAGRRGFVPAHYEIRDGEIFVRTVRWKGSSDLCGLAQSNCFFIAPEHESHFQAGSRVQVLLMD
jgi:molybdopterin molybdotransferase